ncbi:alanine acetyltransferase [Xanthomonas sp. NCPPB 2654]|uniref:alanine acetyltransferase n=1 Tax=unclassified Xanthomonas TaxID=2643310 RepID=UPI0021DFF40F|nr:MULTISPECIES: alanine acetyltransferase [unclassified Xanthomonas]MDL5366187.1 alanine acetyltransferase [Xanthomonas sp. NCPPB 2654]UYC22807.1 alanine acetyltransferase [Xanthomonas sp. CFBP 8443]
MTHDAPLWSAEQHGWLQALGHTLYVGADADIAAVVAQPAQVRDSPAADAAAPAPLPEHAALAYAARGATPTPAEPSPRARAPAAPAAYPEPQRAAPAPVARRAGLRLPDRLQIALLRASGRNPNDPATQTLMATWPLAELRGNAAAKRALWPQLRALRKQAPR